MDTILILLVIILIVINDIKNMIVPNSLTILLILLSIFHRGADLISIEYGILGMGIYPLPFLFIYGYLSDFIGDEALGFGDIKLIFAFGYLLGYSNLKNVYEFFLYSFILASIYGIIIIMIYRKRNFRLPFTPFLAVVFIYFWQCKELIKL